MTALLEGRVALVTGAARGIGRGIAIAFAEEGARVVLADRDPDALELTVAEPRLRQASVTAEIVDVGDSASIDAMFASVCADHQIDILVNNAGIDNAVPLTQISDERWAEMLRINLTGIFLCTRHAFDPMCERGWGRIISIGSQVALKGAVELSHYCAAKAGVHGLMRAVALEGAPHGVTANVIAPGPVDTELLRALPEEWRADKKAEVPLGRFATPAEIAPTAVLLASDGGAYYTGSTLNVSGGDVIA